jgi:glutaredoxin-related protein
LENNIDFTYYDIEKDENALEQFNKLKDQHSLYDAVKAAGKVGLPTFVIDGKPFINILNQKEVIKDALGI